MSFGAAEPREKSRAHPRQGGTGAAALRWLSSKPAGHFEHLSRDIVRERRSQEQDCTCGFLRRSGTTHGNLLHRSLTQGSRDAQADFQFAPAEFFSRLFRLTKPSVDQPKGNRIHLNIETPPLARQGFGEANEAGLGGRIVGLPEVASSRRSGADVDDLARPGGTVCSDLALRRFSK